MKIEPKEEPRSAQHVNENILTLTGHFCTSWVARLRSCRVSNTKIEDILSNPLWIPCGFEFLQRCSLWETLGDSQDWVPGYCALLWSKLHSTGWSLSSVTEHCWPRVKPSHQSLPPKNKGEGYYTGSSIVSAGFSKEDLDRQNHMLIVFIFKEKNWSDLMGLQW